ncbi:hypothetical protein ACVW0P_000505 [Mucilaginibacter sp. UYNi724]
MFYVIASIIAKRINYDGYVWLLLILFLFHLGILYTASSGKSIYLLLIFFFLFFFDLFKFYRSNTTFQVSKGTLIVTSIPSHSIFRKIELNPMPT